ncbi:hypothetical protein B0T21DRAFT_154901 [Apiosordaria backusii]|uniref:Uncharacterized protein n=1 Tax=Apiosordaria backusii TaxID=314023 RepID=A0AA40ED29_9PEZI|nr:hypothetical protein B0T21DRAFT_154901 [Apiosordaria backusii]
MCFGSSCPNCSKQSWRGCGSHVPSVLGSVPEDEWCTCEPKFPVAGKDYPPKPARVNPLLVPHQTPPPLLLNKRRPHQVRPPCPGSRVFLVVVVASNNHVLKHQN